MREGGVNSPVQTRRLPYSRSTAEQQVAELRSKMEEVVTAHAEEEQDLKQLVHQQRQIAEQCSEKVSA